jgi:hypothetical protein
MGGKGNAGGQSFARFSKSLARRRLRPNQEKVRPTTPPERLVPHLQTYLADHRAGIAALRGSRMVASSGALWLSMYGPPMTDNGIYACDAALSRGGHGRDV